MKKIFLMFFTVFLSVLMPMPSAFAGANCQEKQPDPLMLAKAGEKALQLQKILNQHNARVVIVSRVGSDMSKYGIHFTHAAFIAKDLPGYQGKWTVVHLLNQCGTARSAIYRQGLFNFFADDLHTMDFSFSVPSVDVQNKILALLKAPHKLHNPHYSMLAYPFSTQYQNSNQWVLEVLTAAESGAKNREDVQQVLVTNNFKPGYVQIDGMTKFGANLFSANVQFDDHPRAEQQSGNYSVITVDSLLNYLKQRNTLVLDRRVA